MKRAALLVLLGVTAAWGQTEEPGRGVARISVLSGDVSVKRGDSGEWIAAAINAPLVVQDSLHTGAGSSRAEIQFDWANMIRLSSDAEVRLAELEYGRYQIQVARGTTTFRVLRDSDADVEISTPSVSVRPLKRGEYRVTVLDDGTSEVTVRSGEADIFTPRGSERLRAGNTMLARGTASDPEFQVVRAIPEDDWDRWNERRDRDLERSRSYQYVSRDIYGADDLDGYGSWMHVAPYGYVWSPRVAPGWAPYRYGRWSWVDWYGWTWVSHDPWGWAPYHYGRWFYHGSRWCWYPGSLRARNYWKPALVAFFGFGRVGAGVGFGNVGWVPLAPYEPYYPWYGRRYYSGFRNRTYVNNSVHVVNNINIRNVYRNSRITNGITAVNGSDFGRRPGRFLSVGSGDLQRASLVRGQVPLAPGRESLRLANREVRQSNFAHSSIGDRQFFSRRQPASVDRVPFEDQRRGVEQIARQTWRPEARADGGQRGEARIAGGAPDRTTGDETSRGWRRIGTPSRVDASPDRTDAIAGRSSDVSGWRRFGAPSRNSGEPRQDAGRNASERRGFDRPDGDRGADASGWNRFGTPGRRTREDSSRGGGRISGESRPEADSVRSDRFDGGARNRFDRGRFEGGRESRSESLRISPPIVRERQSPRSDPGFSRRDGGGRRSIDRGGSRISGGGSGARGNSGGMRSTPQSGGGGRISGGGSRGGDGGGGRSGGGGGARSQGRSGGRGR